MVLLDRIRQFVREHNLIPAGTRVVAALSGGSDSVALTCLLHELHAAGELRLVGLAHLNHQLRPTASRDEALCAAVASALGVDMVVEHSDVADRARVERRSIESAAHAARYEFFDRARTHFNADVVALGHTRDDQAETFLLRLVRGAGPRGLAAMHPRNGSTVRPLLGCRREQLREYLALRRARGDSWVTYVDDETNQDVTIPRNRIRAELIPFLEARCNANIVNVLADEADIARELWQLLDRAIADASARLVRAEGGVTTVDVGTLDTLEPAVRRGVIWRALTDMAGDRPVAFPHVADALRVADGRVAAADIPGVHVERIGHQLVLTKREPRTTRAKPARGRNVANLFSYSLSIPGEVELPHAQCIVSAESLDRIAEPSAALAPGANAGSGPVAAVRADLCGRTLGVRNRRVGDRFTPVGLGGRKKLQDFFVDLKIARTRRDAVPIVVDESDRIVWVAGHRIDEAFRVTDPAQHVLLLRLRQV